MNLMKYHHCILILIALFLVGEAKATIYYINSTEGNDSNSGIDSLKPWRSLEKLNQFVFKPGDTILFKAGRIYEGQWLPKGSGQINKPIYVDKYGIGHKPRLQGNGVMPATIHLYNVEGWELTNLDVSNYGSEKEARRTGILIELKDYGIARHIKLMD